MSCQGETIADYVTDLRIKATLRESEQLTAGLIICDITDNQDNARLLQETDWV